MNLLYFVAVVIWTATVTATLESDSHGNWSNEKKLSDRIYDQEVLDSQKHGETKSVEEESTSQYERIFDASEAVRPAEKEKEEQEEEEKKEEETPIESVNGNEDTQQAAESQQQFSKQLVQPYVLPLKGKSTSENASSRSADASGSTRVSQGTANETVTVEYIPSEEIILQDYSTTSYNSQESSANDLSHTIFSKESLGEPVENVAEFGQRVRSSSPQLRSRSNESHRRHRIKQSLDAQSSSVEDQRKQYRKSLRPPYVRKLNVSSDAFPKDRFPFSSAKNAALQRSLKQKETDEEGDHVGITDAFTSTSSSSSSSSLGKFSGPIVVPDLPRQKKYSYATTADYSNENNEVSRPAVVESVTPKVSENLDYLAAPPVVLNPLQVGVALMNAGQDLVNGQVTLTKLYPQDEPENQEATEIGAPSVIQSDAPGNSSTQSGSQISQQVVGPVKSVEIQKSVEVFHTAPIQEIHYPVEFVPNVQQLPLVKQRGQEDQRKPGRGQLPKEQRPNQVNVYRSNEILDESVLERGRYEYNANDNDVVYSAGVETKSSTAIFGAKEQADGSSQYDQVTIKYSKLQGVPEINVKQGSYEATAAKELAAAVAQPSRGVDSVPGGLANPENLQITQEAPQQILLTKVTGESPAELRNLLMSVSQSYHHPAEKNVHVPQTVDVVEKKVPYAVEKVIEKQITIPQPFPVHIPIDRVVEKQIRIPYPVHVEKVIEKKVPLAVQRFVIPLPIHFRLPQPVPIPVPVVEKIVEKPVHLPRPYSIEIEKSRPYTLESTKLVKSVPIYNVQPDVVYQQPIRQSFQTPVDSVYGTDAGEQGYYNSSSQFYSPGYLNLNRPHTARQPTLVHTLPKKFASSYSVQYPHSVIYSVGNGNLLAYGRTSEKDKLKDEYVGPVPRKTSIGIQSKSLYSSPDAVQGTLRRTRQEAAVGNTGSFRQSKMEYGFKPPMVPSVQYDEQTATKVE